MTLYELEKKKSENISDFFDYLYESLKNKVNNEELASQMAVEFAKLRETAINCKKNPRCFQMKLRVELLKSLIYYFRTIHNIKYVQWRFRDSVCGIKHPQE